MAELSVKMGVSGVSQFIQSMNSAGASVKTIDAALKQNEQQLKATGDATTYLQQKQQLLQGKLKEQKRAIEEAQKALKKLDEDGADKAGKAFQDMQRKLLNAQTAMMETQQQIEELGSASVEAAGETDQLVSSLGGLNKKVSLEQVISGINSITNVMEKAASVAFKLGTQIWDNIMDSARLGDDIATQATILGMDTTTYQQYKGVFDTIAEVTISDWTRAKRTLQKVLNDPSNDQIDAMKALGFGNYVDKYGVVRTKKIADNWEDALWVLADELRSRVESGAISEDMADIYGQALFGKNYSSMKPLFKLGKEGFTEALGDVSTISEESVEKLGSLNDTIIDLKSDFEKLKAEVSAGLAPALEGAAKVLDSLLARLMEYLQSEEGQKALDDMGKAVEGLFTDLSKIDPDKVVEGFTGVFNSIVGGLQWLSENSGTVISALEAIVIGWGGLRIVGGALDILKLVQGIQGLTSTAAISSAGTAAGASWGSAFASAVAAAAPWLIGLYTLVNPSDTANSDMYNSKTGQLTSAGYEEFIKQAEAGTNDAFNQVAELYEGAAWMLKDVKAMDAMAQWMYSGYDNVQRMIMMQTLDALGYGRRDEYALPEAAASGQAYTGDQTGEVIVKDRKTGEVLASSAMDLTQMESYEVDINALIDAEDGAEQIQEQVGTVTIPVQLDAGSGLVGSTFAGLFGGSSGGHSFGDIGGHGFANGLPWVPFDGYAAILHKGERVLTASENRNYTYNSNNYFGSVNLNNGQDIEALCDSIDRHNRRRQSGFGE